MACRCLAAGDTIRSSLIHNSIKKTEEFGALLAKKDRTRCIVPDVSRSTPHCMRYGINDGRLMTHDCLVHGPLEAVAAHTFVPFQACNLREGTHLHFIKRRVHVSQIFI